MDLLVRKRASELVSSNQSLLASSDLHQWNWYLQLYWVDQLLVSTSSTGLPPVCQDHQLSCYW